MVTPAVAALTTPPAESTPAPSAPPVTSQQPPASAPPQSAPATPAPDKGGKEPIGGGDPQNPTGNDPEKPEASNQPAAPAPTQEPRRQTAEEWQREQAAIKRQLDAQAEDEAAEALITSAPVTMRDMLDTLAEELGVTIPSELRKPFVAHSNDVSTLALKGGERKWKGQHDELKTTLDDTSRAFLKALDTAADMQKFSGMVRDKDPDVWVQALLDVKTPAIAAKAIEGVATANAALLPEGAVRDGYTAAVKGESDPKKISQAFHDALVGVVGPKGEPQVTSRGMSSDAPLTVEESRTLPVAELIKRRAAARS